jgi:uncharacterized protein YicC (UPF0701 family)
MFPTDHFDGSFELNIETGRDDKGVYARSLGYEVRHPSNLEQAVQELNEEIYNAVSRGEIVPSMDN